MREIKFRAWDKEYKKIVNANYMLGNYDDLFVGDIELIFKSDPELIWMQYTGLCMQVCQCAM